ncbi:hypothetical protein B296_00050617 [Ensete ventricosum]|uniref:Chitin-binding type-2 domain-containing protein n=1 Tax=Ensete ventricosum TaxID=4639 RepID=A0A426Y409_ENSVE|nr:hypothetical protein B296_00050617 [Ensete ventricosum]
MMLFFIGIVRVVFLLDPGLDDVLDQFSTCYPVFGAACFDRSFCVKWEKKGVAIAHCPSTFNFEGDSDSRCDRTFPISSLLVPLMHHLVIRDR